MHSAPLGEADDGELYHDALYEEHAGTCGIGVDHDLTGPSPQHAQDSAKHGERQPARRQTRRGVHAQHNATKRRNKCTRQGAGENVP